MTDEYKQGWHDAIGEALKEMYSIHTEDGTFKVIQEETLIGVGMAVPSPHIDAISREEAIKAFENEEDAEYAWWSLAGIVGTLKDLPPVQPKVKTGYWRPFDLSWGRSIYLCTNCNKTTADVPTIYYKPLFTYCPNCGSLMEEEEE